MTGGRTAAWITFFKGILETNLGPEYETPTEQASQIEALDKTPFWKLKGIVAQSTLKLFQK